MYILFSIAFSIIMCYIIHYCSRYYYVILLLSITLNVVNLLVYVLTVFVMVVFFNISVAGYAASCTVWDCLCFGQVYVHSKVRLWSHIQMSSSTLKLKCVCEAEQLQSTAFTFHRPCFYDRWLECTRWINPKITTSEYWSHKKLHMLYMHDQFPHRILCITYKTLV